VSLRRRYRSPGRATDAATGQPGLGARLTMLLPPAVAAVLVLPVLGHASLSTDETATWSAAARSWPGLGRLLTRQDAVYGVYDAVMHLWLDAGGSSPVALRAPSAVAAIGCVALTSRLAFRDRRRLCHLAPCLG